MTKWPGVSDSTPSSLHDDMGTKGRLLDMPPLVIAQLLVLRRSACTFPMTFLKWFFALLTVASHSPLKCGACSGINFHSSILLTAQYQLRFVCFVHYSEISTTPAVPG